MLLVPKLRFFVPKDLWAYPFKLTILRLLLKNTLFRCRHSVATWLINFYFLHWFRLIVTLICYTGWP